MILQTIIQLGLVDPSIHLSMDTSAFLATNARIDYLSMARPAAETLQAWVIIWRSKAHESASVAVRWAAAANASSGSPSSPLSGSVP